MKKKRPYILECFFFLYKALIIYTRKAKLHLRLACRMNVKNETARILRAHAERAASANALVKIYFKPYSLKIKIIWI